MKKALERFAFLCDHIPPLLKVIDPVAFAEKPAPEKWSKKEILGHLTDSAANNHHRFVRGQFENLPEMKYDQNNWNKWSFHQDIDSDQLISFWTVYNKQLLEIAKRIPAENLTREVFFGTERCTLEFLIVDYVDHLEHHLKQIIDY